MDFQDTTLILFFLTNNKCLLVGLLIAGSNSYKKIIKGTKMLISMCNYNLYINEQFFIILNGFLRYNLNSFFSN